MENRLPQRTKHPQSRPDFIQRLIRKFDPVERDFRNRQLGAAGEEMIYEREKSTLIAAGRLDLARKVRWTSREDGDGAGFDIRSFDASGREKFIEVRPLTDQAKLRSYDVEREVFRGRGR